MTPHSSEHKQPWVFISIPFSTRHLGDWNRDSLDKWMILGLHQKIQKMNLEHLTVPKSKEMQNENKTEQEKMGYFKGKQNLLKVVLS